METLGIPSDINRPVIRPLNDSQVSKTSKKTVKDKLKMTEVHHHHHTAASKISHTKKKRRKSHAERNGKKSKNEKAKAGTGSECDRHIGTAKKVAVGNQLDFSLLSDPCCPLITQNRITTGLGIYNKAKKSDRVSRDVKIREAVVVKAKASLQKILDVSRANIPPAPTLDSPLAFHDDQEDVVEVAPPTPKVQTNRARPAAVLKSHSTQRVGLPGLQIDAMDVGNQVDERPQSAPQELSPVSEAAEMMHRHFSLSSTFPGRNYYLEVKDSLVRQWQKQKQSSALQTPRKTHNPVRHHSSVRKDLNKDFAIKSGGSHPKTKSVERNMRHGETVKRSDLLPQEGGIPRSSELPSGTLPQSSSSMGCAPHTITNSSCVNAFEECVLTLQNQPAADISVEDFFPKVETQMVSYDHPVDMLDYIHLSCSNNSDSFSYPDSHTTTESSVPKTAPIYPPHLDPGAPFRPDPFRPDHRLGISSNPHEGGLMKRLREKYEHYSSCSEESPRSRVYALPPPHPPLSPNSPSPPAMFRHRMY